MSTTFTAVSLGQFADLDPNEGNSTAENAGALVGVTVGGIGSPLVNEFVEWSAIGKARDEYQSSGKPTQNFQVDGGNPEKFDSAVSYTATITYADGTTASVTVTVAQDTSGNLFLVPSAITGADLAALEAGPLQSITFDSVADASPSLPTDQGDWNYVTCFLAGTQIETAHGPRRIEELMIGDLILTMDRGLQPIRWIASSTIAGRPEAAPIRFEVGALGNTAPLLVSPQHRMLLTGWRAELYMGEDEVLVPAIQLVNDQSIRQVQQDSFTYYHLMFDTHELIFAAGIPSESFHPGQKAICSMARAAQDELLSIFPQLADVQSDAYGPSARPTTKSFEALVLS